MCIICAELKKNKLTGVDARRNLSEMYEQIDQDHILDLLQLIWEKEDDELWEVGSD